MPDGGKSKNKKKNKAHAEAEVADIITSTNDVKDPVKSNDVQPDATEDHKPEGSGNRKDSDANSNDDGHTEIDTDGSRSKSPILEALRSKDRFEVLVRDRDSLRAEVTDMRKSLEEIQSKHHTDMEALQSKLEDAESKKEHAESQYRGLLERVNTIKAQLGERLKEDAEEIAQARLKIEDLEQQKSSTKEEYESKVSTLSEDNRRLEKELSELRERTNLSQQNWLREKDDLLEQESYLQSEFEQAKEAMHNWEVLAMEERSIRENLGEKIIDLEEQLSTVKDAYAKTSAERDSQAATVDGLQRALQEIQAARKQELREIVESSDSQLEELKQALSVANSKKLEATNSLQSIETELERVRPFEKEVREKNLLIGKLRHEAVTLNDHLTKALRFLKKGKPEDNVDRHIVTNHLLHFLALDRSDPKKFQILQLIAALLGWSDEQREQAGLARPGASGTSGKLRVPGSPMHRTPSTPTLATEFMDNGATSKESLAELWSNFLEQESQASSQDNSQLAK
ncbi:putative Golgi matrix protein [Aspergillus undulatus]|uniref:putative Golgi matrix protein n=1 Tax=Aspergillus undulatus TaxID=1810928 RepID=UPI003CCE4A22